MAEEKPQEVQVDSPLIRAQKRAEVELEKWLEKTGLPQKLTEIEERV